MEHKWSLFAGLLALEGVLTALIIRVIPYTEIDWIAYMQEVGGFLSGELDYTKLRGDTGPLVYPAGFVYIYSGLYYVTELGNRIVHAQYIFWALYVGFIAVVLLLYMRSRRIPWWVIPLVCLSRRIHSIFVLRLFNDCIAMLLLYAAIFFFMKKRWTIGCTLYSLAVSVKMNVMLFAPGLGVVLLQSVGWGGTVAQVAWCGVIQVALGLPFLLTYPMSYISKAFEFSRVFLHVWTVNLKFLPEDIFQSKQLALALLVSQLVTLLMYAHRRWCAGSGGLVATLKGARRELSPDAILTALLESNFIGIVFARTIHYQFYVWYYHALPYLLWSSLTLGEKVKVGGLRGALPHAVRLAALAVVELVYNIYPSRPATSFVLTLVHLSLCVGIFLSPPVVFQTLSQQKKKQKKQA